MRCRRSAVRSRATTSFFFNFTKILVFSLYFASIASFMFMLMLNYPLRVDLKKIKSGYSKFSMKIPNIQSHRLSRLVCHEGLYKIIINPPSMCQQGFYGFGRAQPIKIFKDRSLNPLILGHLLNTFLFWHE